MKKAKHRIVAVVMIAVMLPSFIFMGQSEKQKPFYQRFRENQKGFAASEEFAYAVEEKVKDLCEYLWAKEQIKTYGWNGKFLTTLITMQEAAERTDAPDKQIANLDESEQKSYSLADLLKQENGTDYQKEFQNYFYENMDSFEKRKKMPEFPYYKTYRQIQRYEENNILYFYNNTVYKPADSTLDAESVVVRRSVENLLRRVLLLQEDNFRTDQQRFDSRYKTDEMGRYREMRSGIVYNFDAAVKYAAYLQAAYEYYENIFSKERSNIHYCVYSGTGDILESNCGQDGIDGYVGSGDARKRNLSYFSYEWTASEHFWQNYKELFSGLSEEDIKRYQWEHQGRVITAGQVETAAIDNFGQSLYSLYKKKDKNMSNMYVILAVDDNCAGKDLLDSAYESWKKDVGRWKDIIWIWCITGAIELACMIYLLIHGKKAGWRKKWFFEIYFLLALLFFTGFAGIAYRMLLPQKLSPAAICLYGAGGSVLFTAGAMQCVNLLLFIWMPAAERKFLLRSLFGRLQSACRVWLRNTAEAIQNFRYYRAEEQKEAQKLIQSICIDVIGLAGILFAYFAPDNATRFYTGPYHIVFCISLGILLINFGLRWKKQGNRIRSYEKILVGSRKIAEGDFDYKISTENEHGEYRKVIENLNCIADGLSCAVEEKMKSERMKTELIANVSHDIKTPLTSIINYVGLLKSCGQEQPVWKEYVEVLDNKSQRLKILIEDLIEASKISSGAMQLEKTDVNINELIVQTNGEFIGKLEAKNLTLQTKLPEHPVVIYADGRRVFRILENLYNNVAKYAMPGTRVYASLEERDEGVCFILRNISEQELDMTPEELTERFIRGDVSRTTEGNGLGLSIAKNLMELHGGTLEIYLEGDLFRVTLCFPVKNAEMGEF